MQQDEKEQADKVLQSESERMERFWNMKFDGFLAYIHFQGNFVIR